MSRLLKPLWVALALLFLLEAWLWDKLEPIVERIVAALPFRRIKEAVATAIGRLPPAATLVVFVLPPLLLFPLKLLALWFIAKGAVIAAGATYLFGKFVGLGVTAFLFEACKPKLLEMGWFRRLYERVLAAKAWAKAQIAPATVRIRAVAEIMRRRIREAWPKGKFFDRIATIRRRVRARRAADTPG